MYRPRSTNESLLAPQRVRSRALASGSTARNFHSPLFRAGGLPGPRRGRPAALALHARHLNVHGRYSSQLPDLAGARRPLRNPDNDDDGDSD